MRLLLSLSLGSLGLSRLLSLLLSLLLSMFIRLLLLLLLLRRLHHRRRRRRRLLNSLLAWHRPNEVRRGAHLAHICVHTRLALYFRQDLQALLLSWHLVPELEDPVQTRPDAVGLGVVRPIIDLGGEQKRNLVLLVGAQVPCPLAELGRGLERDRVLDDDDAALDEDPVHALRQGVRRVAVVGVQDHGVQPVDEQVHDIAGVALDGHPVVQHRSVLLQHFLAEAFDFGYDGGQFYLAHFELAAVGPDGAHHLVDFEAHDGQQGRGPLVVLWDDRVAGMSIDEDVFFTVQGEASVIVIFSDGGLGTLGFAGPDVEEAKLMPDEPSDVGFQGVKTKGFAVSVQAHALGHANGGSDKDRVSPRDFFSAERYLWPPVMSMSRHPFSMWEKTHHIHDESLHCLKLGRPQKVGPRQRNLGPDLHGI